MCGSLLDTCILGSGDHHMALGLVGIQREHPDTKLCGDAYARSIRIWQERAYRAVNANIGYVKGHALHHYHGPSQVPQLRVAMEDPAGQPFRPVHGHPAGRPGRLRVDEA